MLFFVLSGYLVGGSALRSIRDGRFSWSHYLSRRLTRLYVVLLPALILGGLLDFVGLTVARGVGVYSGTVPAVVKGGVGSRLGVSTFIGNAFFVQTIMSDTFGSNGPLWSLANEFWYYLIFPMIALAMVSRQRILRRIVYLLAASCGFWFVGATVSRYFVVWCLGVIVFLLSEGLSRTTANTRVLHLAVSSLVVTLAISRAQLFPGYPIDLALGMAVAALIFALSAVFSTATPVSDTPLSKLARYSYTMYLVHLPFLVLCRSSLENFAGFAPARPSVGAFVQLALLFAAVIAYSWMVSTVTEARTEGIRIYARSTIQRWLA